MTLLQILTWGVAIVFSGAALYGLHRGLMFLEKRGYIYYLEKPQGGGGSAFLELDKLIRPSVEYHQEAEDKKVVSQERDGE